MVAVAQEHFLGWAQVPISGPAARLQGPAAAKLALRRAPTGRCGAPQADAAASAPDSCVVSGRIREARMQAKAAGR